MANSFGSNHSSYRLTHSKKKIHTNYAYGNQQPGLENGMILLGKNDSTAYIQHKLNQAIKER